MNNVRLLDFRTFKPLKDKLKAIKDRSKGMLRVAVIGG